MKQHSTYGLWNPGWQEDVWPVLEDSDAFSGAWEDRNWRNLPGPFYGGATDTCGSGPIVAPGNVCLDPDGHEFVLIQPRSQNELLAVVNAASHDPFAGYGADGNLRWNAELVRGWWAERRRLSEEIADAVKQGAEARQDRAYERILDLFVRFLEVEVEDYLRRYLYLLDTGREPRGEDPLPLLPRG